MNSRLTLALALALSACASPAARPQRTTLASLRARAADDPNDLTARRDRALAELVAPGGDAALAEREIAALATSAPRDVRVRFAQGLIAHLHGDFDLALRAWCAAIDAARASDDPLAPVIAEAAVSKVVSLRGDVRDFASVFEPLVDAAARDPGRMGASARVELLETAVRYAREVGNAEARDRWIAAVGCVTRWRVAGPFGPLPMLRFDESLPPEGPGPLAASYEAGADRGRLPTYAVSARGCAANLGRGLTLTGVLYAATDFTVDAAGRSHLHVESPNAFTAFVDGVAVGTIDPRARAVGSTLDVAMALAAGRHTLRVKVASSFHSPLLIAAVTAPDGRAVARFSEASGAANAVPPRVIPTPPSPADDAYLSPRAVPSEPFARYALAELAFSRRHPVAARELLRPLGDGEPTVTARVALGSVALADPFLPPTQARERARAHFEAASRADARAWFPALQLARLDLQEEREDQGLDGLRAAARAFPENPEVADELGARLADRNWDGEADAVFTRFRDALPGVCWPQERLLSLARRRGDGADELRLAESIRQCNALSDAPAQAYVHQRRWSDAEAEYRRLLADDPDGRGLRRALMEVSRARGDLTEAERRGRELLPESPEDDALRADLADLMIADGRRDDARALLDAALARRPAELTALFRPRALLAGREDLEPWRLDGLRVLRAFEASGRHYEAAAVLVLDYTVRRNYPDGSALELTHNVVRVQTQEGVDAYGEFNLPSGATLWRIRTIKADGRVLEPESVAGKDSLSLPDLRPGDSLEFEYLRSLSPSDAAPGGFSGDRFYFRGFEVPYDHSELVVVTPREMPLVVDPRGPAPETRRVEVGGLLEYRWHVDQSDRMTPEPSSIASREFIPSVAVGHAATWERFADALRSRLMELDPADPEALALARRLTRGARTPSEKIARVHRWVIENIQQEGAGTPFESAPRMVAARRGHRTRVLRYLLTLAGVRCDVGLVRLGNGDATRSELADDQTFQSLMLRAHTERGPRWITAADANAPSDYVPPAVAGGDALMLLPGAPRDQVPPFDPASHSRAQRVSLTLDADGGGHATVEERLVGYPATGARAALRRMDAANRDRQFEAYVGGMVTGASLRSLDVDGVRDPEHPLVMRYAFTAPGMATRAGSALRFDGMFHAEAARTWAETPTRTVPLWNGDPVNATLELDVTVPEGAEVTSLPRAEEGRAPGVRWSIRWERTARGFHLTRHVEVPTGRVSVEDYPAFAASVRALDAADGREAVITPRR
ncbi:MAG: tetratricopeptide repeat protein [Polyangiales bacterium]